MGLLTSLVGIIAALAVMPAVIFQSTDPIHIIFQLMHHGLILKHTYMPKPDEPRQLSVQYRAFEDILTMRPVANPEQSDDNIAEAQKLRKKFPFGSLIPKSRECRVEKHTFNVEGEAVVAYWVYGTAQQQTWLQNRDQKFVMYLHGGAYMLGDISSYGGFECEYSKRLGMPLLHVEYSPVPEAPLPKCVHETVAVYNALLEQNPQLNERMVVSGDSAGGALSLLFLQAVIKQKLPVPRGAAVMSPWADLSSSGASYTKNADIDIMIKVNRLENSIAQCFGGKHMMDGIDVRDPQYSPVFGSFKKFPPMLIHVGTAEILHDESVEVYKNAKKAGVDVELVEGEHMCHVYPLFFQYAPEADEALNHMVQWIKKKL